MSAAAIARRFLGSGRAWWLLTVILVADGWYWSAHSIRHTPLLAAPCFCVLYGGRTYHPVLPHAMIVKENGALRIVGWYDDDSERVRSNPRAGEIIRGTVGSFPQRETIGLFAPVVAKYNHTMGVSADGPPFTQAELIQIRSLYSAYLSKGWPWAGEWNQTHARLLGRGDGITRQILWPGLFHDLLAAVFVGMWLASTYWCLGPYRVEKRRYKRRQLLEGGLCPRCRYDIRGCPQAERCPECGETLHE